MKVVVAIDSFKGSLSANDAARAVRDGVLAACADAEVCLAPLGDGGEGTAQAIVSAVGGTVCPVTVSDPLGNAIEAAYGIFPNGKTAVMEMASAAGITLVPEHLRNPLCTTTYGVGEMIVHAIRQSGCRNFIIGIGGSATNDGGVGMLSALGFRFLDADGEDIPRGAHGLSKLARIDTKNALPELKECVFRVACDVENPLCGARGCSVVYGPQKGATAEMVANMDRDLAHYAKLTAKALGEADASFPGAGAAGGMGFAFRSYLGASLVSGIALVMDAIGLEKHIACADVVVTGEGKLDGQSCMGKAPIGVASLAKKYEKTVIALCGCAGEEAKLCHDHGIDAFFPIVQAPCTVSSAMESKNAFSNLKSTAEEAFRLIAAAKK